VPAITVALPDRLYSLRRGSPRMEKNPMISLTVIAILLLLGWLVRTLWRATVRALAPQVPVPIEDLAH